MKYRFIKIINIVIMSAILFSGCKKKNNPPYAPYTPRGPANGLVSESYDFSSLAIDPNYDSVAIRFDWGNGDTSDWSQLVATDQIVTMSCSWTLPNTYYVKTQAKDQKEAFSEWSLPLYVTITIPESTYQANPLINTPKFSTR
jgi:PBP1b-binding outer membrane lipoprotein LpoB